MTQKGHILTALLVLLTGCATSSWYLGQANNQIRQALTSALPTNAVVREEPAFLVVWESWSEMASLESKLCEDIRQTNITVSDAFPILLLLDENRRGFAQAEADFCQNNPRWQIWPYYYVTFEIPTKDSQLEAFIHHQRELRSRPLSSEFQAIDSTTTLPDPPSLSHQHVQEVTAYVTTLIESFPKTPPPSYTAVIRNKSQTELAHALKELRRDRLQSSIMWALDALVSAQSAKTLWTAETRNAQPAGGAYVLPEAGKTSAHP